MGFSEGKPHHSLMINHVTAYFETPSFVQELLTIFNQDSRQLAKRISGTDHLESNRAWSITTIGLNPADLERSQVQKRI